MLIFIELLTVPPGFNRGLLFTGDGYTKAINVGESEAKLFGGLPNVNLLELVLNEPNALGKLNYLSDSHTIDFIFLLIWIMV